MARQAEMAIVIYSCERNSGMWEIVGYFLKKYWKDCPYPVVLVTDYDREERGKGAGFDYVVTCDSDWATMMYTALRETRFPYFITWMDDYLLCDYVDTDKVAWCLEKTKELGALNMRLSPAGFSELRPLQPGIAEIRKGEAYSFSTQAGIWETKGFISTLRKGMSAWDYERVESLQNTGHEGGIYASTEYMLPYIEGVRKGRWFPEGAALLERNGIRIADTGKEVMSSWEVAKNYIKSGIIEMNPNMILKTQNLWDSVFHKKRKRY